MVKFLSEKETILLKIVFVSKKEKLYFFSVSGEKPGFLFNS
nr:hypothetical protein [Candidatus Karelsulcia muelleri]